MTDIENDKEAMETGLEIAVIGMAGRFPGAGDINQFWNNLKNGVESITFFSEQELEEAGCDPRLLKDPRYIKAMGYLQDLEYFDGAFFGYTPMESEIADPQVRILHECAWEALEDAGYDPGSCPGRIGFYSGAENSSLWETLTSYSPLAQYVDPLALGNLNNKDYLSTRISYKLNLRGPAFTVHTACSTSLVAIHLAVQGLLNGECEMAMAGGVRVTLPGKSGYLYQEGLVYSPDGHCRAFDARGKGTVSGDGAGLVVLKSLEEARADNNHIYAIIKGSAINNDGVRKVGYHAPSIDGQSEAISAALYTAEVDPETVGYIETHGTATELGDTVEIEALKLCFNTTNEKICALGSVKTNVGHLGCAAGVTGFIKTVLILKHRLIPPSLHFEKPNPKIDFENSPFYVNTHLRAWQSRGKSIPFRAGVSSFGIGGTNAHIILEAASIPPKEETPDRPYQLLLLSARTPKSLEKIRQNLAQHLKENPISLTDVAYTLQIGRKRFPVREKIVCRDAHELIELLTGKSSSYSAQPADENRKVVFMFPGLGPQYVNMGQELYQTEPFFRAEMDRCFEIAQSLGYDIKEILYPSLSFSSFSSVPSVAKIEIAQLLMFSFEYSLARLIMHWGIKPHAMTGYSFGEYVAACLAGVFSLEDILKLLVARGKMIAQLPQGTMLSVPLPVKEVLPLLPSSLSMAIDNGQSCVVSGLASEIEAFAQKMKEKKIMVSSFDSPYAAHSQMLDTILPEFTKEMSKIQLHEPEIPYISTVTGNWITIDDAKSPAYWARQLRTAVYFVQGIRKILEDTQPVFLEIGPGRDMSALVNRETGDKKAINLVKHRGVQQEIGADYYLLDKLGRLWLYGVSIDWQAFHSDYPDHKRYRVPLPKYPFERQRHWQIIDDLKAGKYIFQRAVNAPENSESSFKQPPEKQLSEYKTVRYERPQLSTRYTPPQNHIEHTLVKIWQQLFGIEEIGITDDFFELGGDSLKAINVLAMLHKETNRLVPLEYFFDNPTIKQVTAYDAGKETVFVSIQPLEKKEYYCLSSAQKRMYFFQQVDPGSVAYNNFLANTIAGDLDIAKLTGIFKKLIERHDSLRTSFIEVNGELVQRVHDQVEFEILATDVITEHGQTRTFIRPFDLSRAPLLRVGLINRILIVDMHHIISDGSSLAILIEEFIRLYQGQELPFLPLQYKDYAGWQNLEMAGGALASQREYWLNEFAGDTPILDLPYDFPRPRMRSFAGKVLPFEIDAEQTRALERLTSSQGVTLYMALLAITNIFLARLSGQETVVVGTPTAGRTHADLERIIGMFVNTLPLKNEVNSEKNISEFLRTVKEKTLSAFTHQEYQYEELVEHLHIDRSSGRNPLFDTLFALQNVEIRGITIPDAAIKDTGFHIEPFPLETGTVKFDLSIECFELGDTLSFNMEYGTELFKEETAARFVAYFKKIITAVVENPHEKIAAIEIVSKQEKEQLLFQFNDTAAVYPQDKTIQQLFAEQAAQTPDYIALTARETREKHERIINLTYDELNIQADQVAGALIKKGAAPDNIIGIMMERSIEMIICILGVLKSGGAYLPIDPESPQERIDYMLKDSNAKILINKSGIRNSKSETNPNVQKINDQNKNIEDLMVLNLDHLDFEFVLCFDIRASNFNPLNLAYIIYTSGSTGKPKGVMVDHRAVVNRLYFVKEHYGLNEHDVILQKTAFTFDVSVCELFRWILPGAKLCLLPAGTENQPGLILDFMIKHHVTTIDFVPSALTVFLEYINAANMALDYPGLRWVFIGAEVVHPALVSAFTKALSSRCHAQLINAYGPTETVVDVTYYNCTGSETLPVIPIGKPMANVQLLILDKYFSQLQPVGVPGELCIAGRSLARGYLNNPELTNNRFEIKNKSFSGVQGSAARSAYKGIFQKSPLVYKTGDLARWLPDGNIEFLGRIDSQVKIRGFRVELDEIENCLRNITGIKETFVLPREDTPNDIHLCAYFVSDRDYEITELRENLVKQLPGYMVPTFFVRLEKFPLTSAGKIDRHALPQPERKYTTGYTAPRSEIETKLVKLWAGILGQGSLIGIDDNFFQLGGHSLKAATLMSKIHKELEIKIGLMEIFKTPTIRDIARLIQGLKKETFHAIEPIEKKEYYPLSSAQKRLYFLQQLDLNSTGYNMPLALPLGKEINKEKLELALRKLIERHESLRTSFERINEEVVQRVHDQAAFEIENFATDTHGHTRTFIRPFDLAQAPLMRSGLVHLPDENYLWIVDIHHIVSDGTSHNILTRDFMHFYNSDSALTPLPIQYKDFSHWQNTLFAGEQVKSQWDYWQRLYTGEIPCLHLPADYKRPGIFTFAGDQYQCRIEKQEAAAFKALGVQYEGTLYMNMMAAFNTLFYKYTGQTDIIIGSGIAGRRHADIQNVVGMFVNTLAMRNYPSGEKTYEQFLQEVIAASLKGFENQDVQFEELVEKLEPERDPSRNPLFDVSMVVQNFEELAGNGNTALPGANSPVDDYKNRTSKFDLTFFISEAAGDIYIDIEYYTGIFKEETIIRMVTHFKNLLKAIIANPSVKLKDIDILSTEEKNQLLEEFNNTAVNYPKEQTIHALFEEQVSRVPDRVALVYQEQSLSFQELEQKANRLAHYLQAKHLQPGEFVGVLLDRSLEQMIALLGILKAGGGYLPLDYALPEVRIKNMIQDTQLAIILSSKRFIRILNKLQWECPSFNSFLCLDSTAIYQEEEIEKSGLMDQNLWDYVANSASDEITGGGWFNSYNGEAFSSLEMAEYGDNVLKKLLPLLHEKMNVLEIGCGSGITMYRIAPKVSTYYATDLSQGIIENNRKKITREGYRNISLARLAAHEIDQLDQDNFDLIIINSVIQSFHGLNYLRKVIMKAIAKLSNQGYLFLGDILDQELKESIIKEMVEFKYKNPQGNDKTKTDWSEDLFAARGFFVDLKVDIPAIEHVEFSNKIYTIENELTKFRYDALITINKQNQSKNKTSKYKYQEDINSLAEFPDGKVPANAGLGSPAYIIYTSGSTGQAKGVVVCHANVVRLVKNANYLNYINFTQHDRFMLTGAFAFDISTFETWGMLLNGMGIYLVDKNVLLDLEALKETVTKECISIVHFTPQLFKEIVTNCPGIFAGIRCLLVGGDVVTPAAVNQLRNTYTHLKILHMYGPTENTTFSTFFPVDKDYQTTIPIGKPISNSTVYILNSDGGLQPVGVPGELCTGGAGVACGYLNNPELTSEKFINFQHSAFSIQHSNLYFTGDLARWLSDSNIEFLGRIDQQVKVRGFRIEIQEIENRLLKLAGIREAIVIDRLDGNGNKYLCAYVVTAENNPAAGLRELLAKVLPDYMIPAYFIPVESIPLTITGKVDRKALPDPESLVMDNAYVAPRNDLESKMIAIWHDVLAKPAHTIGIDANFFQLGGHSLKATTLVARVHKELNVKIPLVEVFKTPTIRQLANYIRLMDKESHISIEPVEKREYYVLSSAQKRMYFLQQFDANSIGYNMPMVQPLGKEINKEKLESALQQLIARHESLRTSFERINEEIVQRIHDQVAFEIENLATDKHGQTRTFIRPFDLAKAPLMRSGLITMPDGNFTWVVDVHHIISDGTSHAILSEDFAALYNNQELKPLPLQYKDFAAWQQKNLEKIEIKKQMAYWLDLFSGEIPHLNLALDYKRPPVFTFTGDTFGFTLTGTETKKFKKLGIREGGTLYMNLLAALNILFYKYTGQEDIILGSAIAGRRHADLQAIVGMFINSLAMRNFPTGDKTYQSFLQEVINGSVKGFENQDVQFEDLVDNLNLERDASRNPVYDVMLTVQNFYNKENPVTKTEPIPTFKYENLTAKFDLTFFVNELEEEVFINLEYYTAIFKPETIQRLAGHLKNIMSAAAVDSLIKIKDIEIISAEEKQQILFEFNDTFRDYPLDKTIQQLFAEQAAQTPDHIALTARETREIREKFINLTYDELNKRAGHLAGLLIEKGVHTGNIVAVMMERSIEMITGILGILKSGCAYMAIDSEYPQERIDYMLKDSNAGILINKSEIQNPKSETNPNVQNSNYQNKNCYATDVHVLNLDHLNFEFVSNFDIRASNFNSLNLAYIIYTSGSTGKPKAVMVEHRNVVRLVKNTNYIDFQPGDRLLQTGALEFDASTFEIWGSLLNGLTLFLETRENILDNQKLKQIITKNHITVMWLTSQLFNKVVQEDVDVFRGVRYLLVGGDVLSPGHIEKVRQCFPSLHIINGYGPTENTTFSTTFLITQEYKEAIPIGKPIANSTAYIVDKHNHLQPIGIAGELLVGGHGIARGYLNNPELTAERFKKHRSYSSNMTYIFYKTGDLARWLSDGPPAGGATKGIIEFLGRIDQQVKIRGFRVELGEIESRLAKHKSVRDVVVIDNQNSDGDKYLCAYIVPAEPGVFKEVELRNYLAAQLPGYMIPAYWVLLDKMPVTANGKIDRRALPQPNYTSDSIFELPANETERILISIWSGILGIETEKISVHDNFFRLGGHSLKATILMSRVHKELQVKIPLAEIFKTPTIRDMGRLIRRLKKETFLVIDPIEKKEYYPLSSAQKRLYFLQQLDLNSTSYNIPLVLPLGKEVSKEKLEFALKKLIERHESLRTSFIRINEEVVQRVHDQVAFEIENFATDKHGQTRTFIRPFDLAQAPLMRSGLVHLPDENYLWVVDIHHIVSDGTSHNILTRDFMHFYNSDSPLAPLPIQYKDFSHWQNTLFAGGQVKSQWDYWHQLYGGEIPRLHLPADYKRPGIFTFVGNQYQCRIEKQEAAAFKALGNRYEGTLYMNMMAAFNTLFYKYTGQTDIIIGSGIAGRRHADIQNVVGMFVNTLAMRNYPSGEKTYEQFLQEVIAASLKGFENQDVQFEELVEKLEPERDPSRNPLFDVSMVVQNFEELSGNDNTALPDSNSPVADYKNRTSKFDLTFFISEAAGHIYINIEYYTGIFKEDTIIRMTEHLSNIINTITKEPGIMLKDIDILSQKEKEQLIYEFNQTSIEFPHEKTVHVLIEEQILRTPDYVSLLYKNYLITYQELQKQANYIAGYLSENKKIKSEEPVGVWMTEPLFRQVALIAILKAGGAFIPLDPATPVERIKYIINDAQISVMLSEKQYLRDLNRLQWECSHFHSYLCIDSWDIDKEIETEKNQLMDIELWHHVGENAVDEITGGGWLSSYTGLPISRAEMDEYGDNTLKKLMPLLHSKMKVLEIGCASGISMYRIATKVGFYYGTDLSQVIINKNKETVREKGLTNIELSCLAAHEIDQVGEKAGNNFDLVIINSVIQCFHGHNYLRSVLQKAIALMGDKGYLFIGDIMDQERKEALVRDLTSFKEANKDKGYSTKTDFSAELFIAPGFWQDLQTQWPEIESVTCSDKLYTIENELTKFRYDALLKINKSGQERKINHKKIKYQDDLRILYQENALKTSSNISAGDLAYIIYTSGSTGKPKGVVITHRSLVNLCYWHNTYFGITAQDRATRYAGFSFDASVWEFFPYLLVGASVCMVPEEIKLDLEELNSYYERNHISISFLPTQVSEQFSLLANLSLRILLTGGDKLRNYRPGNYRFYNNYGPTENTVVTTSYQVTENAVNIPIGKPIANNQIYIFDKHNSLVAVGIPGELQVAGAGIARGYLNNPELTAERFKKHRSYRSNMTYIPFYKTGDLARWLSNGNIEFLGRIDSQVKIRGFRIELGEIETRLLKHDAVKEAVVIERTENEEIYICAYIVPRAGKPLDTAELIAYLSRFLPDYMIPGHFLEIKQIPLAVSGKIDKKALPAPHFTIPVDFIAPANAVEEKLASLWSEILAIRKEKISRDANFFQLGGHSLKATALVAKIHKELNVKIPLVEVFKSPTIGGLAKYIGKTDRDVHISIEPVEKQEYYVLSSAQKRMYFLQAFDANGIGYNMPLVLPLGKEINKEKLETVLKQLITRHESLRTSFIRINEEIVQKVQPHIEFEIEELEGLAEFIRPFDLAKTPLMRSGLIKLQDENWLWVVDMHHIITDGTSHTILTQDFMALYNDQELKPLTLQYKDFASWQQKHLASIEIKTQMAYWLDLFVGEIPRLHLPLDYKRPPVFTFAGDTYGFTLAGAETKKFKELGIREGGTLYMNLLAALNILFYKYTGQSDIIIGSGIAGRRHADLQAIVGMFINSLAMRNYPTGDKTSQYFLQEVIKGSVKGFENQDVQFEDLVDKLNLERDASRNPVFDVMLMVQNFQQGLERIENQGTSDTNENTEYKTPAKFDMTFVVNEQGDNIFIDIQYYRAIFKHETIKRLAGHLKNIINTIGTDPLIKIKDIEMISPKEKKQILSEFNDTSCDYPHDKTIQQLFAEQAAQTPDHIALTARETREKHEKFINLTYYELNRRAGHLAGLLIEKGVLPDDIVAIMMERSIEMIIAILGILKSGGAYLPIDPEYPQERINYMLKDSGTSILLINGENKKTDNCQCSIFNCQLSMSESSGSFHHSEVSSQRSSLSYIIYTSGSTGRPKGVVVRHANVVRLVKNSNYLQHINFNQRDRFMLTGAFAFDISTFEIWGMLLNGVGIYLVDKNVLLDLEALKETVTKECISIVHFTPQLFKEIVTNCPGIFAGVRCLLVGGDVVTPAAVNQLRNTYTHLKILHMYGPTENTTFSTFFPVDKDYETTIPIGKPISNSKVYILNSDGGLQPVGVPGELCTGGDGVACGYLNNPELTSEKFINFQHSAFELPRIQHSNLYFTGDLARWLSDGNIEFLGRIDSQVKIRGFRVELAEIENQLRKHENIKDAAILAHPGENEDKSLCAYFVSNKPVEITELREYLSTRLPVYMVPAYFVQIEKIPLTPNGKIDVKALPQPGLQDHVMYVAPVNEIEDRLVSIWAKVLHLDKDKISTHDNFFNIGGHSLKATSLTATIHKEFNVKIPHAEVFLNPTVKGLANYIGNAVRFDYNPIEPVEKKEYYVLSANQKRLYIIYQMNPLSTAYNMPQMIPLAEDFDNEKLSRTFKRLIERHENLRISFQTINDQPVQKVHDPGQIEFKLEYYEDSTVNDTMERFVRPFDLAQASFLRAGIFKCTGQDNLPPALLVDIHHIISDAVSQDILTRDFLLLQQVEEGNETIAGNLSPLRIQYKDFAEWQNSPAQLINIKQQEQFWLQIFEEEISPLKLPLDFPRPGSQVFAGAALGFNIEKQLLSAIGVIASQQGITMYMMFLALFNVLLARLCGQEDIVIGTASSGRRHADLEQIIGMFVNTLPLRNFPRSQNSFSNFLQEIKQRTLAAFENQDYPFEDLVDKVAPDRDINRNPLFDVMFNFLERDKTTTEDLGPITEQSPELEYGINVSKFDITFTITKMGSEDFHFVFSYCTQLFKKETIKGIVQSFKDLISEIVFNPDVKLAEIKLVTQLKAGNVWADSCDDLENE